MATTAATSLPFLLFILGVVVLLLLVRKKGTKKKRYNLPPGPRRLPIIGNLHQVGPLTHTSLGQLADVYGPLMSLQLGKLTAVVISSADVARDVFRNHDLAFSSRPELYAGRRFSYGRRDITFAPYGEYWRQVRRVSVLEVLSPKRVQSFRALREEEVALAMRSIASMSRKQQEAINLSEVVMALVNDIVCRVAFGRKYGGPRLRAMLAEAQALMADFCLSDFFPGMEWVQRFSGLNRRLDRSFEELDEVFQRMIDDHISERRKGAQVSDSDDFIDALLRLQDDPTHGEVVASMDQMKAHIMDMFVAATDTSSATLVWTMSELLRNPKILEKAQREVRSAVGNKKRLVEEPDLENLQYLKLIVKETLRLHLPAPLLVPHATMEDCKIQGYTIPERTMVLVNARAITRDPNHWDNPDEYIPERFLVGRSKGVDFKGQDFHYIPFGVGRRSCPGMGFAIAVVELILANLLCWFDWKLGNVELDMEEAPGITVHKKNPLWVVATPIILG